MAFLCTFPADYCPWKVILPKMVYCSVRDIERKSYDLMGIDIDVRKMEVCLGSESSLYGTILIQCYSLTPDRKGCYEHHMKLRTCRLPPKRVVL